MTTWLISHEACLHHYTGLGHPECPERLRAIQAALTTPAFEYLLRCEAPRVAREDLYRAHRRTYVDRLLAQIPDDDERFLDGDTVVSPGSGEAALRAPGAVTMGVGAVIAGETRRVFCAVRPPGHHAEPDRAMGFCLFSNAAVGALRALEHHGLERVAVVDFDVHHGNGTQAIAWERPGLLYASTHQYPLFPGTGLPQERGAYGNVVNVILAGGDGSAEFRQAFEETVLPRLRAFEPQLVIISAGFDAHRADPLATLQLEEADFAWATRELVAVAAEHAGGRVVSTLEGGYNLSVLGRCVAAHVDALMT